ncbi:MAG: TonB-dependent receptor plug [Mucilaginibacter sp.]|nr:TonB-dependent receptor plug [Mucilaginibacter sp.]
MKKKHLLVLIMRITFIQIALSFTLIGSALASNTIAQILNRKLTIDVKDKEISKVLAHLGSAAGVNFIYSPVLIQADKKISISYKNRLLSDILDDLFASQNIKYEVTGNDIVLNRIINPVKGNETDKQLQAKQLQAKQLQAIAVTGNVTDEAGQPLIGVTVTIKNSTTAVVTDEKGSFKINVPDNGATLVFKYVGYIAQEVDVNGRTVINVQLRADSKALNEIVVVGYGSQRRANITGAVSSVPGVTIAELPVPDVEQALQGRVAGLNVTNNGSPGTSPIVTIRGISSINFATDPLYVIDGFPTGNLASFDSKDIESVEVLKDASAAAIYGSRASNGVIIITTKKGTRSGKVQVTLDSYAGIQSPSKKLDLLNTSQYVQYALALNGSLPPRLQPANFNLPIYAGASQTYAQTNTNWQNEYFRSNTPILSNNVSLSGGNDISRFYTSGGYFKQDGIAVGLKYNRFNFRFNSDHKISKVFTFGQTFYTAVGDQHYDATAGNRTPLTNVIRMQPYLPDRDPTTQGGFRGPISSFDGSDPTNPVEAALIGNNEIGTLKILGTAYLNVNITSWLTFKSTFGVDYSNIYQQNYTPIYNDAGTLSATTASIANQRTSNVTKLFTQQLTFDKAFGLHHINAVAVYETQSLHSILETASGNQTNNLIKTLTGAQNIAAASNVQDNFLTSYVGRVNYEFASKYLFQASIRRDGLSIWSPGHKYQNFPAASIGWNVNQEDFLKDSKTISQLKLRASYGLTGIPPGALGNFPYLSPIQSNQSSYPFNNGTPGGSGNGSYTTGISNAALTWETTRQFNIGVDLGLINNKFTVTAEYFRRKTNNFLLSIPTAPSEGFQSAGVLANAGAMQNNGVELQLGYHQREGEFKWDVTGLLSIIRNKVLSLNSPTASIVSGSDPDFGQGMPFTKTIAGQSVQQYYGYKTAGIFQTAGQVASSPVQTAGTKPGDIKFQDLSGPAGVPDGKIDSYDLTYLGSFLPKFTYSLNYSASYKSFDVAIFFQGVYGNKILNAENIILQGMPRLFNAGTAVLNAWTPSNTNTSIPRAIVGDPNGNGQLSDRWIESGSYLRLKNMMIGYTVPTAVLKSWTGNAIGRLKIYVSGQNLLTFTKYKGFDPEVGNKNQGTTTGNGANLTNGVDFGQYPAARIFQFGIQAGF